MRLLYIPDWVFRALKAQGYDRKCVLDEKILLSILSTDDVAFLSYIQERIEEVIPSSIFDTLSPGNKSVWPSVEYDMRAATKLLDYRFNGPPEHFDTPYGNVTVELMDENTLVFYPIKPRNEYTENDGIGASSLPAMNAGRLALLDRVIQQTYALMSFPDFALTPLMKDFLTESQTAAAV